MAVSDASKPAVAWNRCGFDEMAAGWSRWRKRRDGKKLQKIFALAADSPLMADALDWAQKHDIIFFVDHTTDDWGYYMTGTGILALSKEALKDPAEAVDTIVHEIRHAWQEYNDMADGSPMSFGERFLHVALTEADATAFGDRAADQWEAAQQLKKGKKLDPDTAARLADEKTDLGEKFLAWFDPENGCAEAYGDDESKDMGEEFGVYSDPAPDNDAEFQADAEPVGGTIETGSKQDLFRLGVNFRGNANYLAHLQPDILPKKVLPPSLADSFWGAASHKQEKRVRVLRKAALAWNLSQPKSRHPWP